MQKFEDSKSIKFTKNLMKTKKPKFRMNFKQINQFS